MNGGVNMKEIKRKTSGFFLQDGLTLVMLGLALLLFAFSWQQLIGESAPYGLVGIFSVIILAGFVEWLRRRYTYPRIGYAAQSLKINPFILVPTFLVMIGLPFWIILSHGSDSSYLAAWALWIPVIIWFLIVAQLFDLGRKSGDKLYFLLAFFAVVIGTAMSLIRFASPIQACVFFFFMLGGTSIVVGLVKFVRFLRIHPIMDEDEENKQPEA
ncbi:MAG: hypothetical protein PHX05_10605 [Acidobacteriota bacterium]|nr:hypothetical protein [Acidobacteriota bacterium]